MYVSIMRYYKLCYIMKEVISPYSIRLMKLYTVNYNRGSKSCLGNEYIVTTRPQKTVKGIQKLL